MCRNRERKGGGGVAVMFSSSNGEKKNHIYNIQRSSLIIAHIYIVSIWQIDKE